MINLIDEEKKRRQQDAPIQQLTAPQQPTVQQPQTPATYNAGDAFTKGYTSRSQAEADIYRAYGNDSVQLGMAQADLDKMYADPTSPLYNRYENYTNDSLDTLRAYGIDIDNMSDDELLANVNAYSNKLGLTGAPSKPTKKTTQDGILAYAYYHAYQGRQNSNKVDAEWKALRNEIAYYARRGYSADEAIAKAKENSDYKTLKNLDDKNYAVELGRSTNYSLDNLQGVYWAARNGYDVSADDDYGKYAVYNQLGYGKKLGKTEHDRVTYGSDGYSPYSHGTTVDDAAMRFGVTQFTKDWFDNNYNTIINGVDEDAKRDAYKAYDAFQTSQAVDSEFAKLNAFVQKRFMALSKKNGAVTQEDAERLMRDIRDNKSDYPTLFKLDEAKEKGKPTDIAYSTLFNGFDNYIKHYFMGRQVAKKPEINPNTHTIVEPQKETSEPKANNNIVLQPVQNTNKSKPKAEIPQPVKDLKTPTDLDEAEPEKVGNQAVLTPAPTAPKDIPPMLTPAPTPSPADYGNEDVKTEEAKNELSPMLTPVPKAEENGDTVSEQPLYNGMLTPVENEATVEQNAETASESEPQEATEAEPIPRYSRQEFGDYSHYAKLYGLDNAEYTEQDARNAIWKMYSSENLSVQEQAIVNTLYGKYEDFFDTQYGFITGSKAYNYYVSKGQSSAYTALSTLGDDATVSERTNVVAKLCEDMQSADSLGMTLDSYYEQNPEEKEVLDGYVSEYTNRKDEIAAQREQEAQLVRQQVAQGGINSIAAVARGDATEQQTAIYDYIMSIDASEAKKNDDTYQGIYEDVLGDDHIDNIQDTVWENLSNGSFGLDKDKIGLYYIDVCTGVYDLMDDYLQTDLKLARASGITLQQLYDQHPQLVKDTDTLVKLAMDDWKHQNIITDNDPEEYKAGIQWFEPFTLGVSTGSMEWWNNVIGALKFAEQTDTNDVSSFYMYHYTDKYGAGNARYEYARDVESAISLMDDNNPRKQEYQDRFDSIKNDGLDIFSIGLDFELETLENARQQTLALINDNVGYVYENATDGQKFAFNQLRNVTSNTLSAGEAAVLNIITGNPLAASSLSYGVQELGGAFNEFTDNGYDLNVSRLASVFRAGLTTLLESQAIENLTPSTKWFDAIERRFDEYAANGGFKKFLGFLGSKVGANIGKEFAQEQIENIATDISDYFATGGKQEFGESLQVDNVVDTFISTAFTTMFLNAASYMTSKSMQAVGNMADNAKNIINNIKNANTNETVVSEEMANQDVGQEQTTEETQSTDEKPKDKPIGISEQVEYQTAPNTDTFGDDVKAYLDKWRPILDETSRQLKIAYDKVIDMIFTDQNAKERFIKARSESIYAELMGNPTSLVNSDAMVAANKNVTDAQQAYLEAKTSHDTAKVNVTMAQMELEDTKNQVKAEQDAGKKAQLLKALQNAKNVLDSMNNVHETVNQHFIDARDAFNKARQQRAILRKKVQPQVTTQARRLALQEYETLLANRNKIKEIPIIDTVKQTMDTSKATANQETDTTTVAENTADSVTTSETQAQQPTTANEQNNNQQTTEQQQNDTQSEKPTTPQSKPKSGLSQEQHNARMMQQGVYDFDNSISAGMRLSFKDEFKKMTDSGAINTASTVEYKSADNGISVQFKDSNGNVVHEFVAPANTVKAIRNMETIRWRKQNMPSAFNPSQGFNFGETDGIDVSSKNVKAPMQIALKLANDIGIGAFPNTNKMMLKNALGQASFTNGYVAIKKGYSNNRLVFFHELGHALQSITGIKTTQSMIDNIPSYMTRGQYTDQQLVYEAMAQFARTYMNSRDKAADVYGLPTVQQFEDGIMSVSPEIYDHLQQARQALQAYNQANLIDQVASRISNYQGQVSSDVKPQNPLGQKARQFIINNFDDTFAASVIDDQMRELGVDIGTGLRDMLRMTKRSNDQASAIIQNSLRDQFGNRINVSMNQAIGLDNTEDLELLAQYSTMLMALDRGDQQTVFGKGVKLSDIKTLTEQIASSRPDIVQSHKRLMDWWQGPNGFVQTWMVNTGLISNSLAKKLKNKWPNYVPLMRDMGGVNARKGKNTSGANGTFKLKSITKNGSDLNVINPLISMMKIVNDTVEHARLNQAAQKLYQFSLIDQNSGQFVRQVKPDRDVETINITPQLKDFAEQLKSNKKQNGLTDQQIENLFKAFNPEIIRSHRIDGVNMDNIVAYQQNGKTHYMQVADPQLYRAFAMAGKNFKPNSVAVTLGKITRTMSMLTTGSNPLFALTNAARDFQQSVNTGSWATTYLDGAVKWFVSAYDLITDSQKAQQYKALGGGGWTRVKAQPTTQSQYEQSIQNLVKSNGWMKDFAKADAKTKAKMLFEGAGKIATFAHINELVQQTSRFAEYRFGKNDTSTDQGKIKAFLAAQDVTVDFSLRGASENSAALRRIIPFYNATLQGTYKNLSMFSGQNSNRAVAKLTKTALNNMLMGAISAFAIFKFGSEDDKEWYKYLSQDMRVNNFVIPLGEDSQKQYLRLPLAQDPISKAMYAVGNQVAMNGILGQDNENAAYLDLWKMADAMLKDTIQTGTVIAPLLAVKTNTNYYGGKIVSDSLSKRSPTQQYNGTTPQLFIGMSRAISAITSALPIIDSVEISPLHLQYIAQQYSGFIGQLAIPALSTDKYTGGSDVGGNIWRTIYNRFTIDPAYTTDITNDYYDGKNYLSSVTADSKTGTVDLFRKDMTEQEVISAVNEASSLTASSGKLGIIDSQISKLYEQITKNTEREDLTRHEKVMLNRDLQRRLVKLQQQGAEIAYKYKQKYGRGTGDMFSFIANGGVKASKALPTAKYGDTFTNDFISGNAYDGAYMQCAVQTYNNSGEHSENGTLKDTLLPHPNTSVQYKDALGDKKTIKMQDVTDEVREGYVIAYRDEYRDYLSPYTSEWSLLTYDEQTKHLQEAHTRANKEAKQWLIYQIGE